MSERVCVCLSRTGFIQFHGFMEHLQQQLVRLLRVRQPVRVVVEVAKLAARDEIFRAYGTCGSCL